MRSSRATAAALIGLSFVTGTAALAAPPEQTGIEEAAPAASLTTTSLTATKGAFLPFSQAASIESQRAYAVGLAGYDSAHHTGNFEAATEVRLWGPIAVRVGGVYTNGDRTLRPSYGGRIQFLRQGRQGVDAAFGVFYRPEGLTEPEGEVESVLSVGRRAGTAYLLGNLLYGQDPEGNERDGEVRLALLEPFGARFLVGLDSRLRFDLGSQAAKLAQHNEPTMDAVAGPTILALLGPIAVSAQGGGSTLRLQGHTSYGAFVMTGVGTAF